MKMNDVDVVRLVRDGRPFSIDSVSDAIDACCFLNQCQVAGHTARTCEIFSGIMAREDNPCWLKQAVFDDVVQLAANDHNVIALVERLACYNDKIAMLTHELSFAKRYANLTEVL